MRRAKPHLWQTAIVAFCAAECVWSFSQGRLNAQYIWWLAQFLAIELTYAVSRVPGGTLSERFWCWLGIKPRAAGRWLRIPLGVPFPFELAAHLASGGAYPWTSGLAVVIAAVPLALVIAYSLRFDDRRK